ncbi:MAG: 50S ribosomal protein L11 methyltransferase [Anaerolineae bacterium]
MTPADPPSPDRSESSGDYIEISLPLDGEAAEAVCELFERHGGGAVVETRLRSSPESGRELAEPEHWVRTYIPARDVEARERVERGLWHLSRIHPLPEASIRQLAEANWAEAWKSRFTPQRIGDRFLIVPSWLEAEPKPGDLVIRLDPGMSFGTGLHPTTRLCLTALESFVAPGSSVLDVGTGSGVLAIGAALLGAERVVAIDIAPTAVETATANAAANGVGIETVVGQADALGDEAFDTVVANLLAGTIVEAAGQLYESVLSGGWLIASGVLDDQVEDVAAALTASGFHAPTVELSGDWAALMAQRPELAA